MTLSLCPAILPKVSANDDPTPPKIENCRAYALYDLTHSRVVALEGAQELLNTSTSAKVMMGLLACELLGERCDETVLLTTPMLEGSSGNSMHLKAGERIKIIDLLYGAICGSYNDAAYALSYIASGSANDFVSGMNSRAAELGALSTHYKNPLGFPDDAAMLTTVSDTLKIAAAASQNPLYMEICSAKRYTCSEIYTGEIRSFYNRNQLISSSQSTEYFDPDCSGMNAGVSGKAGGWSVITLAHDDSADYICVVLGGSEDEESGRIYAYDAATALIGWARKTYNNYPVLSGGEVLGKVKISLTAFGTVEADYILCEDVYAYIPDRSSPDITYTVEFYSDDIKAPIKAGEEIGILRVYSNGHLAGEGKVTVGEDFEANAFMAVINALARYTGSRAFIASAVCFVLLTAWLLIIGRTRAYGRGRKRF